MKVCFGQGQINPAKGQYVRIDRNSIGIKLLK